MTVIEDKINKLFKQRQITRAEALLLLTAVLTFAELTEKQRDEKMNKFLFES